VTTSLFGRLASRLVWGLTTAALLSGVIGCGGGGRRVEPVTATVTYKGEPVADATVTFISEGAEPVTAFGRTDAQGTAKPTTPQLGDGVVPGKQKVLVEKVQIIGGPPPGQESSDYAPPDAVAPKTKDLIPAKYKLPGTTPLSVEVATSGSNDFKLELAD
jgi:hypothetical protein